MGSSQSSRQADIHDLDKTELQIPRVLTGARASRPGPKNQKTRMRVDTGRGNRVFRTDKQ